MENSGNLGGMGAPQFTQNAEGLYEACRIEL